MWTLFAACGGNGQIMGSYLAGQGWEDGLGNISILALA